MMCIGWRSKQSCYHGLSPVACPTNPWLLVLLAFVGIDLLRGNGNGRKR